MTRQLFSLAGLPRSGGGLGRLQNAPSTYGRPGSPSSNATRTVSSRSGRNAMPRSLPPIGDTRGAQSVSVSARCGSLTRTRPRPSGSARSSTTPTTRPFSRPLATARLLAAAFELGRVPRVRERVGRRRDEVAALEALADADDL